MILHPYLIRWRTDTTTFLKRTFVKPTWDWMCVLSLQWHSMSFTMVPRSSSTIDAWSYAEIVKGEYTFYLQHHHHRMINYLTHIIFKDLGLLSRMTSAKPAVVKAKWKGIARKRTAMLHASDVVEVVKSRSESHAPFAMDYAIPNPRNRPLSLSQREVHPLARSVSPTKVMKRYAWWIVIWTQCKLTYIPSSLFVFSAWSTTTSPNESCHCGYQLDWTSWF